MSSARTNIGILYWMVAMQNVLLFIGVLYPFFASNGISTTQYFILQGTFSLAVLFLEVPSGYLSDRWGRKNTLVLGSILGCIAILIYALATNFWAFLIGECILAIGYSCYSGTAEALSYDSLLEIKEEKRYRKVSGNLVTSMFFSHALCSVASGVLAITFGLRSTVWLTLPFMLIALALSFFLIEPVRHKLQETRHIKMMMNIMQQTIIRHVPIRSIIFLSSTMSAMTFALVWFTQPYQELIGLPLSIFGVPNAIAALFGAALSQITPRLEKRVDDRLLFTGIVLTVVASYLLLGFLASVIGLIVMLVGRITIGALIPVTNDIINRMTSSDVRATVLSIRNLSEKLIFAVASPFLGYFSDVYSLNQAMLFTGVLGGIVAAFLLLNMTKVWKEIPA